MNTIKRKLAAMKAKAAGLVMGTKDFEPGDHLLEVLGVIIIAVVLLIFFKDEISNLFENAINGTTTKTNALFNAI